MENRKRAVVLFLIGITFFIGIATIKKIAFRNCPISNNMTLKELQEMDIQVIYIEDSKNWSSERYEKFSEKQVAGSQLCDCVLIGKPTGNIYFNRGNILQEINVKKILQGECSYEKIWIRNGLRSTLEFYEGVILLKGMDRSFMQQDCEYLLFLDSMTANEYSDKKVYTEAESMWFGCYNLTRDCDIVMIDDNMYNPKIEFYTSSYKTLACYNEAKKELISIYNLSKQRNMQ